MCLICVEFQRDRMTVGEARRALREMVEGLPPGHVDEVQRMLAEAEDQAKAAAPRNATSSRPPADPDLD